MKNWSMQRDIVAYFLENISIYPPRFPRLDDRPTSNDWL